MSQFGHNGEGKWSEHLVKPYEKMMEIGRAMDKI